MNAFFEYIRFLEGADNVFSDRMKKAITYALNQEKTYAGSSNTEIFHAITGMWNGLSAATGVGRVNWLFADTINGAKVNAIMYSMIETAKANQANIPIYLQYLFEQIPLRQSGGDKDFMVDMMLWSETYRTYEEKKQRQRQSLYGQLFPEPERPRTPRKKDRRARMPEDNGLSA